MEMEVMAEEEVEASSLTGSCVVWNNHRVAVAKETDAVIRARDGAAIVEGTEAVLTGSEAVVAASTLGAHGEAAVNSSFEKAVDNDNTVIDDDYLSEGSEYDEGPLDGKMMQIYLPDKVMGTTPCGSPSGEEDISNEKVRIVKLGASDCVKEVVIECSHEAELAKHQESGSKTIATDPKLEVTPHQPVLPSAVRSSVIVQPPTVLEQSKVDAVDVDNSVKSKVVSKNSAESQVEQIVENSEEDMLQIFEIVTGQNGGVQQITVVANNGTQNRQSVNTDQIRQIINSLDSGGSPVAARKVGTAGESVAAEAAGSVVKILQLQVVAADEETRAEGQRQRISKNEDLSAAFAAHHLQQEEAMPPPAVKSAYLAARQSYTRKWISRSVKHVAEGRTSTGTQASTWTKMPDERTKVARNKLIRPSAPLTQQQQQQVTEGDNMAAATGAKSIGGTATGDVGNDFLSNISIAELWEDQQRRSIGTQVARIAHRGLVDDEEDLHQKNAIVSFIESGRLLERSCPGCGKILANLRNLFRHLETKHEIRLAGKEAESLQQHFQKENMVVQCKLCLSSLSRKSLNRHLRIMHSQTDTGAEN